MSLMLVDSLQAVRHSTFSLYVSSESYHCDKKGALSQNTTVVERSRCKQKQTQGEGGGG